MPESPRCAGLVALHDAYRRSEDVSRGGLRRTCPERRVQQRHRAGRTARSLQYKSPEWRRGDGATVTMRPRYRIAKLPLRGWRAHDERVTFPHERHSRTGTGGRLKETCWRMN